jgi:hypothetical protein
MSEEIPPYFKVLDDLLFRFNAIVNGNGWGEGDEIPS